MLSEEHRKLLSAYVDGEVKARQRKTVLRLLRKSAEARSLVRKMQDDSHRLRRLPRQPSAPDLELRLMQAFVNRQESSSPTPALASPPATLPLWLGAVAVAAVLLAFAVISFFYFASGPGPRHPTPPRANKGRATSLARPPAGATKVVAGLPGESEVQVGPRRAGFLGLTHFSG
jgi:anti-sigma factor RsiW